MATAAFWQRGEALDYPNTSGSKIAANTIVVVGSRVGVIGGDIENGSTGSIHMGGVWEMPKTGSSAISLGQTVYWDGSGITDVSTSNTEAGYAAAAAAADATSILVKLNG
jgi:predicted RecA/RadA family phage recombinase